MCFRLQEIDEEIRRNEGKPNQGGGFFPKSGGLPGVATLFRGPIAVHPTG